MTVIETHLDGNPAQISGLGDWLRTTLSSAAGTYSDVLASRRSTVSADWTGDAADGFTGAARQLATGGDTVATASTALGDALNTLSSELQGTLDDLEAARSHASAGGLTVIGTQVQHPGSAPVRVADFGADATPAQAAAYSSYVRTNAAYSSAMITWDEVVGLVQDAATRWETAVESAGSTWAANSGNLVSVSTEVFTRFGQVLAVSVVAYNANAVAATHQQHAASLTRHIDAIRANGVVLDRAHFYNLMDTRAAHLATAADLEAPRTTPRVPTALGRAFGALGVVATGYGIYQDIQDGESTAQAVTSNVGGFAASLAAGAGAGAIVGSFIPVPVLGTVTGIVVGGIVGGVVGIVTSGMIDSMWENGVESLGDVGNAIADGWNEVVDTGAAIADIAGDVGGAVADTAKDVWNAIF